MVWFLITIYKKDKELDRRIRYFIEDYWDIFIGISAMALAFIFHTQHDSMMATLFSAIGIAALSLTVAEVADILSERLQEPYPLCYFTGSSSLSRSLRNGKGGDYFGGYRRFECSPWTCRLFRGTGVYAAATQQRDLQRLQYRFVCRF